MSDPEHRTRLAKLEARIAAAKKARDPAPRKEDHHSQAQVAWRMVLELVTGLLIGFGIGYGLDVLFGTRPIMLVLFTLLGFAAGVRVMLRTADELNTAADKGAAAQDADDKEEDERRG